MNLDKIRNIIEAIIFSSSEPVSLDALALSIEEIDRQELTVLLEALMIDWRSSNHAFQLVEVAGGWQFRTKAEFGPWLQRLHHDRPTKLSRPSLETLAVIAYKQPITRPEIEDLRGVDSGAVVKNLLERNLIRIIGKKDAPGKPVVYGTSTRFLEVFSLRDLGGLPSLRDLKELDEGGEQLTLPAVPRGDGVEGEAEEPVMPVSDSERRRMVRESVRGLLALPVKHDEKLDPADTSGLPQTEDDEDALVELERALKRRKEAEERTSTLLDESEKEYIEKVTSDPEPAPEAAPEQPAEPAGDETPGDETPEEV